MRTIICSLLILLVAPAPAAADDEYLTDEWTAFFHSGVKVGWQHEEIVKAEDEATGEVRVTRTWQKWTPVGNEMIEEKSKTVTDKTGRIVSHEATTKGARGNLKVHVEGRAYKATLRQLPPESGTLDQDAYDIPTLSALIRNGDLPEGERSVHVLKVPGRGTKQETFSVIHAEGGTWRYEEDEVVTLHGEAGEFISSLAKNESPYDSQRPATEGNAADRSIHDGRATTGKEAQHVAGLSVEVHSPGVVWGLRRTEQSGMVLTGMEHPLQVIIFVLELQMKMGETAKDRTDQAEVLRSLLSGAPEGPRLGASVEGTYDGHPATVMDVEGEVDGVPLGGKAYLLRSKEGGPILVVVAYPRDMQERCQPLAAAAMGEIKLDTTAEKWKRVTATRTGLSFEVPESWTKSEKEGRWSSPIGASIVQPTALTLPEGMDVDAWREAWLDQLQEMPTLKDLKAGEVSDIEIDGVKLRQQTVTWMLTPEVLTVPISMTAIWLGGVREDGSCINILLVTSSMDSNPGDAKRILSSLRWTKER